jgi:hypothetical protein
MEVGNTFIPLPRAEAESDLVLQGLRVCSDGMVRDSSAAPVGLLDHVRADLQQRARRLRETGEAFPANPYRLATELLDSGPSLRLPGDRDVAVESLARIYREELRRALQAR